MAIPGVGLLWQLARRIEKVFEEVDNANRGLAKLRDELNDLEKRVTALEGREELLVENANCRLRCRQQRRDASLGGHVATYRSAGSGRSQANRVGGVAHEPRRGTCPHFAKWISQR
jgi:hypothetical protein